MQSVFLLFHHFGIWYARDTVNRPSDSSQHPLPESSKPTSKSPSKLLPGSFFPIPSEHASSYHNIERIHPSSQRHPKLLHHIPLHTPPTQHPLPQLPPPLSPAPKMCHALLTTCRHCTWILSITYPRCSHAKAYAIPPPSCPHRMARRYKPSGLCSACKTPRNPPKTPPPLSPPHRSSTEKPRRHEEVFHRKDSLSITPCAVRIAFRDTQLGAVAEADKPRNADPPLVHDEVEQESNPQPRDAGVGSQIEHEQHMSARNPPTREARPLRRTHARARARVHRHHAHLSSLASESDADADAYVASPSPSPSVSSSTSTSPVPACLPRLYPPSKPRRRSPGVLERIARAKGARAPVKKGRRGRPPKRKVEWPNRVDAEAWEEVVREREAKVRGKTGGKGERVVRRKDEPGEGLEGRVPASSETMGCERDGRERRTASRRDMEGGVDTARGMFIEMGSGREMCGGSVVGEGLGGGENIAHSIALEAAQREKKWR